MTELFKSECQRRVGDSVATLQCGPHQKHFYKLPEEFVDLVITSPPYGDVRNYGGFPAGIQNCISEAFRTLKPGGIVCWIVQDTIRCGKKLADPHRQVIAFLDAGFSLHDTIIWDKGQVVYPNETRWGLSWEFIFIFSKGKPKTFNSINDRKNIHAGKVFHTTERTKEGELKSHKKGKRLKEFGKRFAIWENPPRKFNEGIFDHPAQMPSKLAEDLIFAYSNPKEFVLDPFAGAGTTLLAALKLGRSSLGFEAHEPYFERAKQRIEAAPTPLGVDA